MTSRTAIGHLDRCRMPWSAPGAAAHRPGPTVRGKEWHHIVVHTAGLHLLLNLSETEQLGQPPAARIIVMAYTDRWHTSLADVSSPEIVNGLGSTLDARYGHDCRFWWDTDHFRVEYNDPAGQVLINLRLDPCADPTLLTGIALSASERLSWLFVPRLQATGSITIDSHQFTVNHAHAYHDHNWGSFDWGGDYAWEWLSSVGDTWSATASRLLDGVRGKLTSQFLQFEINGVSETFRDGEVVTQTAGRWNIDDTPIVPGVMRLLVPAILEDVPETMLWTATRGANHATVCIEPTSAVRLVVPDERRVDQAVTLVEIVADATVSAAINGQSVHATAPAIFELVR